MSIIIYFIFMEPILRLMEAAPPLKTQGLDEDYKQIADFNCVVLAGHPTSFGIYLITWNSDNCRTCVSQGIICPTIMKLQRRI